MAPRGETGLWHALSVEEVLRALGTDRARGLSADGARRRLEHHGPNRLPEPPRPSALVRFLRQFHDILIYVLLVAAAVTLMLGEVVDTAVILAVVLVNAIVGFWQEGRAEQAMDAIRRLLAARALVLRDGHRVEVPAEELVPGDVVFLAAGDRVPADARLIEAVRLEVDESVLTGESVPVSKGVDPVRSDAPLAERRSMVYSGTLVTRGRGVAVVVATGTATEVGRIGGMLERIRPQPTPLARRLEHFSRWLTVWILLVAAATLALGLLRQRDAMESFMAAVSLAVAAIPEGLPAIVTITLAIGVERMARRNAIVRRMPAIETLGSVDVICSDKTGTFTKNEMTAEAVALAHGVYAITGSGYAPHGEFVADGRPVDPRADPVLERLLVASVLCNESRLRSLDGEWTVEGDPTEGALLVAALKAGLDVDALRTGWRRIDEIPFDSELRFMAVLVEERGGRRFVFVKGALERLLSLCTGQATPEGERPLDAEYWIARMEQLAGNGDRVLAVAAREVDPAVTELPSPDRWSLPLSLLGLVGLLDPPRPEAIEAVAACRTAGIRVKMITGDHAATARAIAARLGLAHPSVVLTGFDLDRLSGEELGLRAEEVDVFARTAPEHKLRLVEALQRRGHVVAMTGDGVNDAPALRRADVGVAMGRKGTEAAREAAEIVLADDNFATIAAAVAEGRTVYDNIRKAIAWILPTNAAESLVVLAAMAFGLTLPLSPVQVLWVNTITAITLALPFPFEAPEQDVMSRPPRRADEPFLSRLLVWRMALIGLLGGALTFFAFDLFERAGASLAEARTVAVNALVACEAFYLFAACRLGEAAFSRTALATVRPALIGFMLVWLFQLAFTYLAWFNEALDSAPIGPAGWAVAVGAGIVVLAVAEADKWLQRRLVAGAAEPAVSAR